MKVTIKRLTNSLKRLKVNGKTKYQAELLIDSGDWALWEIQIDSYFSVNKVALCGQFETEIEMKQYALNNEAQ